MDRSHFAFLSRTQNAESVPVTECQLEHTVPLAFTTDRRSSGRMDGTSGTDIAWMPNYGKNGPYVLPPSSPLLFLDHALFINTLQPRLRGLVASIREGVRKAATSSSWFWRGHGSRRERKTRAGGEQRTLQQRRGVGLGSRNLKPRLARC